MFRNNPTWKENKATRKKSTWYRASKDLVCKKDELEYINIIKQWEKRLNMMAVEKRI